MENLVIQKYGGSSLSSLEKIKSIAKSLAETSKTKSLIIVVSAMGKATDNLLDMAYAISNNPKKRELDMLLTTGERITMSLLSIALNQLGVDAISLTGSQAGILTSSKHSSASIVDLKPLRVHEVLNQKKVVILAGFQGVDPKTKEITTLGRGGSDTTAVHLADYFKAPCEIYTDVDGVHSADPNQNSNAIKYDTLTYDELIAMTQWGNPVLHKDCIILAKQKKVKLKIKKSLSKQTGTALVFDKAQNPPQCLSVESQNLVFCLLQKDIEKYHDIKETKKLFSLYELGKTKNHFLITGETSDLDLFKKSELGGDLANLSTVSFVFSSNYSEKNKIHLKNTLSKKFSLVMDWLQSDLSLTATISTSCKKEFLTAANLLTTKTLG